MKIGLALSGGGARGIAHLGIIQALEESGVEFHMVSGTSAGAIAGAFYCAGYHPTEILGFIEKTSFFNAFRPAFNWRSLLNLERASTELRKYFPNDRFEDLKLPLRVTTTDIAKGKLKVFKKGPLIKPILASSSIPVVFEPIRIGKRNLVDGGLLDNLPVDPLKKNCDKIVALHCNPIDGGYRANNWRDLLERSMMLPVTTLAHTKKKKCDLFLEPPGLSKFQVFDFKKARDIFQFGYDYAIGQIESGCLQNLSLTHEKAVF